MAAQAVIATEQSQPPSAAFVAHRLARLQRRSEQEVRLATSTALTVHVLKYNERTLVYDFPTLLEQARTFVRIVLFIERHDANKTRVMAVAEAQQWLTRHGIRLEALTVGNNFRAGELARFFNTARVQGEPLTVDEQRLYAMLIDRQVLREDGDGGSSIVEPEMVLISVPQASSVAGCTACSVSMTQRQAILEHELAHARLATDTPYRDYANWFWSHGMDMLTRSKFMHFLRKRGYDTANRELMANEMQAFMMHTSDPAMFSAAAIEMTEAELENLHRAFPAGQTRPRPPASGQHYRFD